MQKEQPNYYAIIPANVRYDKRLTGFDKLLYGEITALTHKEGYCWATNEYFASLYNVAHKTISRGVKKLVDCGYILSKIQQNGIAKMRYMSLPYGQECPTPLDKNVPTPMDKNVPSNNTSINNTSIIGEESTTTPETMAEPTKSMNIAIGEVIKAMEVEVDIKNKLNYGNKKQREACKLLLDTYGKERVLGAIGKIKRLRETIPYFPSITTPYELLDKWQKAQDAIKREELANIQKPRQEWQLEDWEKVNLASWRDIGYSEEVIKKEFNLK